MIMIDSCGTVHCVSLVLGSKVFGGYFDVTYSIRVTDTEVITAIKSYVRCLIDLWDDVLVLQLLELYLKLPSHIHLWLHIFTPLYVLFYYC